MFKYSSDSTPFRIVQVLDAAEKAARMIPPAFPLDATVAVNPFLGQTGEDLATASARLTRVAGAQATQDIAAYQALIETGQINNTHLNDALLASTIEGKPSDIAALKSTFSKPTAGEELTPLPTVADLAAEATGVDWPTVIKKTFGLWAAGHFDQGQALWSPMSSRDTLTAWRAWAAHDLVPEIAGLTGFCAHAMEAPDTSERAIQRAAEALGLCDKSAETAFHRLFMDLGGWSQHARWLLWQAEQDGENDRTMVDLLAIRLIWEEALLAHVPSVAVAWANTVAAHATPIAPSDLQVQLAILQDAADRAHQCQLSRALVGTAKKSDQRPLLQAAFCIDVRSEVMRRALESVDPSIETFGFAGFFGLPLVHKAQGSDIADAHLPVLLKPSLKTTSQTGDACEQNMRMSARAVRAWGRFRQAAVSSFAFVEAVGPFYAGKLLQDALGAGKKSARTAPPPKVLGGFSAEQKTDTAAAVLKAMSLTKDHAEIVLLLGHGAQLKNNPHESAYHCGACGGHTGEVSARLLAGLLNDPETRAGLSERGLKLPEDTVFVAGLHNTTTDAITLFDKDSLGASAVALRTVREWLDRAGHAARLERAKTLPGHSLVTSRAHNWAEVRPEWGLAGCSSFIAGPRSTTAGKDLGGRAFLHSYNWQDDEGFATLELILTAPVVVASWISLQYYGSAVAPGVFGAGNKLIHNVVGGIGVVEGNGGHLRPGLPWQALHDGEKLMHDPLRLTVMIEAPCESISGILEKHPDVRALFDNGWLHLLALKNGQVEARYRPGLLWQKTVQANLAA